MPTDRPSLPARTDTLLGVCQGMGEDIGFDPTYLRVALAMMLLWQPVAVIALYLALGVVLAVTHRLIPAAPAVVDHDGAAAAPANDEAQPALPLAA